MIWSAIAIALVFAALAFMRRNRREDREQPQEDTGLAILEFGHAFPNEAIRQVISTAGGRAIFLRLHDGKVGCMRAHGNHFACHLIEPGTVRVADAPGGTALTLTFLNTAFEGGTFEFRTARDAAEVSLWLLGSFMPVETPEAPLPAGKGH